MAVTAKAYGQFVVGQFGTTAARRIDWVTDTIKVALAGTGYTPDQDAHDFFTDVTDELAAAGGYTAGGETLSGKSVAYTAGSNLVALLAAATTWTGADWAAGDGPAFAVVYKDTGAGATSPLIGYLDLGGEQNPNAIDFVINWHATEGVVKATIA